MTWKQFQQYLKGKLIERYQTHGTVKRLTNDGIFKIRRDDDSIFQIPYDKNTIRLAKDGQYREKTSGEIVDHPDFIMTWEITTDQPDMLEQVKKFGYVPKAG